MKKPRGDSKVKTMAPEQQKLIFGWLCAGTYESAVERVREEFGIETSAASLSDFFSWYSLGRKLERAANVAEDLKQLLVDCPQLNLDDGQVTRLAQKAFEMQAVQDGDAETFLALTRLQQADRKLSQDDAKLQLDVRRFEWDAAKAVMAHVDSIKAIKSDKGMNEDQKLQAVRERLFGVVPAEVEG